MDRSGDCHCCGYEIAEGEGGREFPIFDPMGEDAGRLALLCQFCAMMPASDHAVTSSQFPDPTRQHVSRCANLILREIKGQADD